MLNPRAKPFQPCNNQPVTLIHRYHAQPTAQVLHNGYYPISPYPNNRPCYYKAPYPSPPPFIIEKKKCFPPHPIPIVFLPLQSPPPNCVPFPTFINKKPKHPNSYAHFKDLDFNVVEAIVHGKTSVMIKNIPNSFRKKVLLEILDKHCFQENEKIKKQENEHSSNCFSEYDFLYLPMDFRSGYNLGYAFVNFTSAVGAVRFYNAYHKFKWDNTASGKFCIITQARIQGREKLMKNFQPRFACHTDEFLPNAFTPT